MQSRYQHIIAHHLHLSQYHTNKGINATGTLLNTHSPLIPYPYSRPVIHLILSFSLRFSITARRPLTDLRPLQLRRRVFTPFNPFAFTNCVCIGLAVFAFKALKIPCLFAFSGGKTQKCKYYYWNCCNSKSLQLTSYKFHTMYVKTLHYSQMLINVYEINVLTVKI